jgi:uncharacterized membrane protein YqjE
VDPDTGIPDLVRRLTDDSKRLVRDEVRLAKLETGEAIHEATRGTLSLAIAFGVGVVALVALTIMLATLLGRWIGHYWAGTLIVGAVELVAALVLVRGGLRKISAPSYTLEESREELRDTVAWAKTARQRTGPVGA